ncbi:ribosomal protein S27-domain-containing protein [Chiua virens]|nr:ribosomal protein S27-domain-containing protein [Chiua virens]
MSSPANFNLELSSTITIIKKATHTQQWYVSRSLPYVVANGFHQPLAIDLLNPSAEHEKRQHKLKRLVQSPNSYFMDVKCPGCFAITTVFSHAQSVVLCGSCASILCQPTGGKARLTEGWTFTILTDSPSLTTISCLGSSFRRKN